MSDKKLRIYRSVTSGRLISHAERVAAARTRVTVNQRRGLDSPAWLLELAGSRPPSSFSGYAGNTPISMG